MKKVKFTELFDFLPKSKIKAGDGLTSGKYPLFTSSQQLTKYVDNYIYDAECLIFGTGGQASIHYYNGKFSTSTDCFVVSAKKNNLDLKYVYLYLKSHMNILEEGFKGAGLKHISKKYISNIRIPLPDILEEQRKIANLLTQVEKLIEKREESIGLLDKIVKSSFFKMFISNSENKKWKTCFIKDLAEARKGSMRTGPFGSNLLHEEFQEEGDVAVLGIDNAVNNRFEWKQRRYITYKKYEELKRYRVYPEDVIITIMGTVGRSAVIPTNIPLAINTKHLAAITLDKQIVNSFFLAYSIHSDPMILSQIKNKTRGAIMAGFNLTLIKNLKLKIPPKPLQDKFSSIVKQVEVAKVHYQESLNDLNKLVGSLSQKAFKGELDLSKIPQVKTPDVPEGIDEKKDVKIGSGISISSQHKRQTIDNAILKIFDTDGLYDKKRLDGFSFKDVKMKLFEYLDQKKYEQKFSNEHIKINKK